ncbi:MAG: NifU family protein [Bacilli bacterium]|nr:NifU family protein [Bacilli bacterium]
MKEQIEAVLDRLRPYLMNDGGDIEFVDYKDGICYLKFLGHCATCSLMNVTLNEGIKEALINEIPEITDVELIANDNIDSQNINFFDVNIDDDF